MAIAFFFSVSNALPVEGLKIKKLKASANPPQYAAFSKPLSKTDQPIHILDRLTFGARPADVIRLQQIGLKNWLDEQLHPGKIAENPLLDAKLSELASLRMGIHETYVNYPPPRMIAAFARGRGTLPEDPQLRAVIVRLADQYLEKKDTSPAKTAGDAKSNESLNDPNDDSDLNLRMKLSSILTPAQAEILKNGKPEQKTQVLASIPAGERMDFAWALRPAERRRLFPIAPVGLRRELMLTVNPENVVAGDLTEAKVLRAVYSNYQLAELLDDFWFNHFNVYLNKGSDRYTVPTFEREAIRPHLFGKFYDLLLATAKSPAMLFYLDNWESVAPQAGKSDAQLPRRAKQRGLNENYGRELLELHTLGVDGGYTQKDVTEVARCFTGWTIANPRKGGGFEYNDKVHDKGQKLVLGHIIQANGGMNDGLQVLDILAHHPSTAHFISYKLAQRFVADNPPTSLVVRMSKTFIKTGGDLRQVTQTMLTSPEFWSQGAFRSKVKTPFEMVASSLRATNADITSAYLLQNELRKLGEPLYRKIEPTGYSNLNSEWVNSAALLERMNFGLALAQNRVTGIRIDISGFETAVRQDPMALARTILEQDPSVQTRAAISKTLSSDDLQKQLSQNARTGPLSPASLVAGLALGSPEFQRH